jgi:hypothetical protein
MCKWEIVGGFFGLPAIHSTEHRPRLTAISAAIAIRTTTGAVKIFIPDQHGDVARGSILWRLGLLLSPPIGLEPDLVILTEPTLGISDCLLPCIRPRENLRGLIAAVIIQLLNAPNTGGLAILENFGPKIISSWSAHNRCSSRFSGYRFSRKIVG